MNSIMVIEKAYLPPAPITPKDISTNNISCTSNGKYIAYGIHNGVCLRALPDIKDTKTNKIHLYTGASKPIIASCVSSDQECVVGFDLSNNVYIWKHNQKTVELSVHNFNLETLKITDIQICSQSEQVAIVGIDSSSNYHGVCVSTRQGEIMNTLDGHEQGICSVTIQNKSPHIIATAGFNGFVNLHSSTNYKLETSVKGHDGRANCIRFSTYGDLLGSCGDDGYFKLWTSTNGEVDREIHVTDKPLVNFSWSLDSTKICAVGLDCNVYIVRIDNGMILSKCSLEGLQTEIPTSIAFTSTDWAVIGTQSGTTWGLKTKDQETIDEHVVFVWQGLQGISTAITNFRDQTGGLLVGDHFGNILSLLATNGNIIANHRIQAPEPSRTVGLVTGISKGAAIFSNGAVGIFNLYPRKFSYSVNNGYKKENLKLDFQKNNINYKDVKTTGHGRILVHSDSNISENKPMLISFLFYVKESKTPIDITTIIKGKGILVAFEQGLAKTYSFEGDIPSFDIEFKGTVKALSSSFDGGLVAVALEPDKDYPQDRLYSRKSEDNKTDSIIEFYDTESSVGSFKFLSAYQLTDGKITCIALDPRGTLIAAADTNHKIYVADIETGRILINTQWNHHKSSINCLKWSPCGKYLCSASDDYNLYLWNINDVENPINIKAEMTGKITSIGFPFDNYLAVSGESGALVFYDIVETAK